MPRRFFDVHDGHARSGEGAHWAKREAVRTVSGKPIERFGGRTAASSRCALIFDEAPLLTRLAATEHLGLCPACGSRKSGCLPRSPSRRPLRPERPIGLKTGVDCRAPGVYSNKAEQE